MRSVCNLILILLAGVLFSCNECEDCLEYDEEPFIKLRFFEKSNLSNASVAILAVNGLDGSEIVWFQDTTNEFTLPLSMNEDASIFKLTWTYPADSSIHFDSLDIGYQRKMERTVDNYMQVNNYFTEILGHSFDSLSLICTDTLACKSNEAIVNIYF